MNNDLIFAISILAGAVVLIVSYLLITAYQNKKKINQRVKDAMTDLGEYGLFANATSTGDRLLSPPDWDALKKTVANIKQPEYSHIIVGSIAWDNLYNTAKITPDQAINHPYFAGLKITRSAAIPEDMIMAVGTTCRHCGQSTNDYFCPVSPMRMHEPKMTILKL